MLGPLSEDLGWERVSKILAGGSLRGSTVRGMSPEEIQWRPCELRRGRRGQRQAGRGLEDCQGVGSP